jgi:hypothetical protein
MRHELSSMQPLGGLQDILSCVCDSFAAWYSTRCDAAFGMARVISIRNTVHPHNAFSVMEIAIEDETINELIYRRILRTFKH